MDDDVKILVRTETDAREVLKHIHAQDEEKADREMNELLFGGLQRFDSRGNVAVVDTLSESWHRWIRGGELIHLVHRGMRKYGWEVPTGEPRK